MRKSDLGGLVAWDATEKQKLFNRNYLVHNHRIIMVGSDLVIIWSKPLLKQGQTELAAQDHV